MLNFKGKSKHRGGAAGGARARPVLCVSKGLPGRRAAPAPPRHGAVSAPAASAGAQVLQLSLPVLLSAETSCVDSSIRFPDGKLF